MVLGDGEIVAPIYRLKEGGNKLQMSGFEFMNMVDYGLKDKKYTIDLLPYCNHKVIAMIKKMGYMPSMGLGKEGRGVVWAQRGSTPRPSGNQSTTRAHV